MSKLTASQDMIIEEQAWLPIALPKKANAEEELQAEKLAWLPIEISEDSDGNTPPHPPAHKVGGRRVPNPKNTPSHHNDLPSIEAPVLGLLIHAMNETVSDTVEINPQPKPAPVKVTKEKFSNQPKHDKAHAAPAIKKNHQIQQPR